MFVIKSIVIQIKSQSKDLSIVNYLSNNNRSRVNFFNSYRLANPLSKEYQLCNMFYMGNKI
jgi:hypothetical protein